MLKMAGLKRLARLLLILIFSRRGLYTAPALRSVGRLTAETIDIGKLRMSETNSILDLLEAGIRAENLRQKAIANNIANLETPGYRRIDVQFEKLLAKALSSSGTIDLSEIEPQIHRPKQTPVKSNGNDVNLEFEVGQMVKNTLRHKTYIRLLNKKYNQIELAMGIR